MGQQKKDDKTDAMKFAFPQCRELDDDLESDMYSLVIFASRLRNKKRRRLMIETAHRFLTQEIASDSDNYRHELGEAIIAPKLLELYREIGGVKFQQTLETALSEETERIKAKD